MNSTQMWSTIGQAPDPRVQPVVVESRNILPRSAWWDAYTAASVAGTVLGAYHGYKRNDSIGWAIGWALLGGAVPLITIPVAYAQGFGQPERR